MSKSTVSPATADMVRAFYNDEKAGAARVERFGLADDKSIRPGARGRLSKEAVAGYNKGKPAARHYVTGSTKAAVANQKAQAQAHREAAKAAGLPVGTRGPLSNAAKAQVGIAKPTRKGRKG